MHHLFLDMPLPMVTPEGTTVTTSTQSQSSVTSLIPDPTAPKPRLPKARVFIHRLPKTSFIASSERYAFDDDFPSIAASDSTHACFLPRRETIHEPDFNRTSFRDRLRRLSKKGDSCDDSIIEDFREKRREIGCAEFITHWFGRKEKDLDPPVWHDETDPDMLAVVGYDDFMHGARRPSAAARMVARIRGG